MKTKTRNKERKMNNIKTKQERKDPGTSRSRPIKFSEIKNDISK